MTTRKMTPTERVRTALNHKEPDRVPLDLGSTKMTGISFKAYNNFITYKHWNDIDPKPNILDPVQQLAFVQEDVLGRLGVDIRGLLPSSPSVFKTEYREVGGYT